MPAPPLVYTPHRAIGKGPFLKRAENNQGFQKEAAELHKASALAPWWADAYYNLGLIQEKAGKPTAAIKNLKLYMLAKPSASDHAAVEAKIIDLEVTAEIERQ